MISFKPLRKFDFFLSLIIALGLVYMSITDHVGIGFPKENELKYTTGVFSIVEQPEYVNHVILNKINGKSDSQLFTCSYSVFGNGDLSSCGDKKYLVQYVGNVVTVGWYKQKEFLGFKNDVPQLVTIEMNNEIMSSYDKKKKYIKSMNDFNLYIFLPISILSFPFYYWLFGWLSRPKKSKDNDTQ
ncbi:hypothetical protein AADH33_05065 [Psychrobacter sp. KFRI-CH2-11]|uniref:hypothetical protein n=1 Tax=Psychrobacter sp. KFRI-CH2-11 TaxID=3156079 RepID=UPI002593E358|nr:hypothetical protein [uncultured Psychrobacter sp.]